MRHFRVAVFASACGVRWSVRGLHGYYRIAYWNHRPVSKIAHPVVKRGSFLNRVASEHRRILCPIPPICSPD